MGRRVALVRPAAAGAQRVCALPAALRVSRRAAAPRIVVREAFEGQSDARLRGGWQSAGYGDAAWRAAVALRTAADVAHARMQPGGIPFRTLEPALPQRILSGEAVRSIPHR